MLLGLGLGVLVLAMVIGVPIVNGFVHAIRRLTDAAEVMSGGDLSHAVDVGTRGDELATLARAFEQMRVELDRSRAALVQRLDEREELIRLKEVFLAGISHELRTPLNAIIGYTDMLSDEVVGADAREYLTTVRAQSEHLLRLLSDLLTLSGLNTGTLGLEISPVRVPTILARLKPLADELRAAKDVVVHFDCPSVLPTMETDPLRLEQVLANLLSNALKFTERGQVVLRVLDRSAEGRIAFEVTDTGIGIASHELTHIFDEFRQVDGSLTRVYGGVGLGLSLVKKLVALLHGTVTVESQPRVGSTFSVELPLRLHDAGTAAAA
jgi:signal transduction histidine kinase